MTAFFVSDTHFGHANVILYCKRPYADVAEMNRAMTERWNARVKPGDTVYHLGDFALGPGAELDGHRAKLAGHIVLVKGNHDRSTSRMLKAGFNEVVNELYLELDGVRLFLHHQPMPGELWQAKADIHLCGHVHDLWTRQEKIINVGVDVRDFEPKTLEELSDAK
jgi:calcineurin-like phosphoesterase family protein